MMLDNGLPQVSVSDSLITAMGDFMAPRQPETFRALRFSGFCISGCLVWVPGAFASSSFKSTVRLERSGPLGLPRTHGNQSRDAASLYAHV